MQHTSKIVRSLKDLHDSVTEWNNAKATIGFVPTMGALHAGHLSLVRLAQEKSTRTIVSIFVNPTQFGPNEDFDAYPRQEAEDIAKLDAIGVDLIFIPSADDMYPEGFNTTISVHGVTEILCGAARPGHFDGVATVVTKLFQLCQPDIAVFGEKDYQQLFVIRRFTADLNIPVEIVGGQTARETDGLAISSRNAYLSEAERAIAPYLNKVLKMVGDDIRNTMPIAQAERKGIQALLEHGFDSVDYLEVRAAASLERIETLTKPVRILAAARLGSTRLIDNIEVTPNP